MMYKIGYIDDDRGYLSTFRNSFRNDFNVVLFKVENNTTAQELAQTIFLNKLQMVIIDFKLNEYGNDFLDGNEVSKEIRKLLPRMPLVILTSDEDDTIDRVDNSLLLHSKDELDSRKIDIFKTRIKSAIKFFLDEIEKNKETIKVLSEKRSNRLHDDIKSLDEDEEELLFKAYIFLNEVFPEDKTFKEYLSKPSEIKELINLLDKSSRLIHDTKSIID